MDWSRAIILGIGVLPLAIYLGQGVYDYLHVKKNEDYFLAGRCLGTKAFALNASTSNFSFTTAIYVMLFLAYTYGAATWWALISCAIGFVAFANPWFSPIKDTEFFRTGNTLHEYLGKRYNSNVVQVLASVPTIFSFLGFFAVNLYLFSVLVGSAFAINSWLLLLIVFFVVVLYTCLGGYVSVVKTDTAQLVFIVLGVCGLGWIAVHDTPNLTRTFSAMFSPSELLSPTGLTSPNLPFNQTPAFFLPMLLIINGLWQFSAMDMWQRALAARQPQDVTLGNIIGSVIFVVICSIIIFYGVELRLNSASFTHDPSELALALLDKSRPFLAGIMLAFFASALLSCGDTILIAASQSITNDLVGMLSSHECTQKLWFSRVVTVSAAVVGLLFLCGFALLSQGLIKNIVAFVITLFSCQIVLAPVVIYAVIRPGIMFPHKPAIFSVSIGFLTAILFGWLGIAYDSDALQAGTPVLSLAVSTIVLFIGLGSSADTTYTDATNQAVT